MIVNIIRAVVVIKLMLQNTGSPQNFLGPKHIRKNIYVDQVVPTVKPEMKVIGQEKVESL